MGVRKTTDRLECLSLFINSECRLNWRSISEDSPSRADVWRVWIGWCLQRLCPSLWAGQGQFQMCHSCIWANSYLDKTTIHYTTFLFKTPSPTALFFILLSSLAASESSLLVEICHIVGFVTPCDTWCELSVETWENVCRETSKGGLLFMITWKTIVCRYWLGDLRSSFFFLEQMQAEARQWEKKYK